MLLNILCFWRLLFYTSVFWPWAARTRLFGLINSPKGALRPPPLHRSFAGSYSSKIKNNLFPKTKCFPSGPNSGRQRRISFHWTKLHPTELHCTLLSYTATSWATLCPILSYPEPCWATMHPTELCCIQLIYVALGLPSELSCTLLS
jgi:hypothetical protein